MADTPVGGGLQDRHPQKARSYTGNLAIGRYRGTRIDWNAELLERLPSAMVNGIIEHSR